VTEAAPRIAPRLRAAIENAARDERASFADLCRAVGAEACRLGLPKPSYEQVRTYAHVVRRWHAGRAALVALADSRARRPFLDVLLDRLAGVD
jgi:hypothetical protein